MSATPQRCCGATYVVALAGCAAELDFAPAGALRSNNRGESDGEVTVSCGTATTPQARRHRRGHKGVGAGTTRAIAALGLSLEASGSVI